MVLKCIFLRNKKLSDDYTVTSDVIKDFFKNIKHIYKNIKIICCIYPANPLLSKDNLIKASKIIINNKYDYVLVLLSINIQFKEHFTKKITAYLCIIQNIQKSELKTLETLTMTLDSLFWESKFWLKDKKIFQNSQFIEIARNQCCDIDNKEDWNFAKILFKNKTQMYKFNKSCRLI